MPITDLPALAALRTKMHWHQERQRILAENVANADTPQFQPRDLVPMRADDTIQVSESVAMFRTSASHFNAVDASGMPSRRDATETRPAGNGVNLEDEMMKVASNQMDYQAATTLYSRSLGLIKTAIGKR